MPPKQLLFGPLLLALLAAPAAGAAEYLLYDESAGNKPQDQAWMTYFYDFLTGADPGTSAVAGGVTMDSTGDLGDAAGFFNHGVSITLFPPSYSWTLKNPGFPALERNDGFRLSFELLIRDEDHFIGDPRAGFSVLLLGDDLLGVELGFWEDEIWSQDGPDFNAKGESALFDTTAGSILYELTILGSDYLLTAGGTDLLTGALRDYSAADPFPDPYETPNMLFLGDNTGSAGADFTLGRITLTTDVPAPATGLLLAGGLLWLGRRRRAALRGFQPV